MNKPLKAIIAYSRRDTNWSYRWSTHSNYEGNRICLGIRQLTNWKLGESSRSVDFLICGRLSRCIGMTTIRNKR